MRLVLLALFNGHPVVVQIGIVCEALDSLLGQVTVRHGVPDYRHPVAQAAQDIGHPAGGLALAAARPHGAHADHRLVTGKLGVSRAHQAVVRAGRQGHTAFMHDVLMGHIGISEDDLIDLMFPDQVYQRILRHDRDTLGVQAAGQLSRVGSAFNIRNLCSRECHHLVVLVVAEIDIEVVKVAAGRAHDNHTTPFHEAPIS